MTLYLLKLARFVSKEEQQKIIKDFRPICRKYFESFKIMSDSWRSKNRILLQIQSKHEIPNEFLYKLLEKPGIITIIEFFPDTFEFNLPEFKSLIDLLVKIINSKSCNNTFSIDFRSYSKIPFHKRSIIDRLKKKKIHYSEEAPLQLYFEVNQDKKTGNLIGRLGQKIPRNIQQELNKTVSAVLVLYSPFTVQEVADFFRLGLSFNTKIIFSNENNKVPLLLKKVKKTFFKGIDKVQFEVIPDIQQLISQDSNNCYGFSLWGKKNINDLSTSINDRKKETTNNNKSIHFLFGNEEVGLPLRVREKIPIFRIGTASSEPMRASQAAAYILGFLSASRSGF
ncbi:MAG: hypothetical protein ACTSW1_14465 [Candidatus Hodarchaeales archaeon]